MVATGWVGGEAELGAAVAAREGVDQCLDPGVLPEFLEVHLEELDR
jgi:hypothetical protein